MNNKLIIFKPRDWPSHVDVVGTLHNEHMEESNSIEITEFLKHTSQPPLYIGFGSMIINEIEMIKVLEILIEACAVNNVRLIFQSGWTAITQELFHSICQRAQEQANLLKLTSSGIMGKAFEIFPEAGVFCSDTKTVTEKGILCYLYTNINIKFISILIKIICI